MQNTNHYSYKNLIVYKKAKTLAIETIVLINKLSLPSKYDFLKNQIFRSVTSIGANIAEGNGRLYKKDYRHFLSIARSSCFETDYWFEILSELKITNPLTTRGLIGYNEEIIKMLTTMMKNLNK